MKIGALILAHEKPLCLQRLLDDLDERGITSFINLDGKSDPAAFPFLGERPCRRLPVRWGGYSQVAATLALIRDALRVSEITHLYLMSGRDFLIQPQGDLERRISASAHGGNFITIEDMPYRGRPMARFSQLWFNDIPAYPRLRYLIHLCTAKLPALDVTKLFRGIVPATGDQWWLLSRHAAETILSFIDENQWFARAFRFSDCPDEHMIQTAFRHLGLRRDGSCPTFSQFPEGEASPLVIDEAMYGHAVLTGFFGARKFDRFYPGTEFDARRPTVKSP